MLILAVVLLRFLGKSQMASDASHFEAEEIVLGVGFLLVPILAFFMAAFVTKIFMLRYGLAAVCGLGLLVPAALRKIAGDVRGMGILLSVTLGMTLLISISGWPAIRVQSETRLRQMLDLEQVHPELPLVVGSGLTYLELDHYASDRLTTRIHFLADPAMARQFTGTDMFDLNFPELHRRFPIRSTLSSAIPFLAKNSRFVLYSMSNHPMDWLLPYLKSKGWRLSPLPVGGQMQLYLAEAPEESKR